VFDVFIFVFIYVVPGCVVVVSYSLTGSRLLTADQSLRRQQSPGGADDDLRPQRRRRWQLHSMSSDTSQWHRHASPVHRNVSIMSKLPFQRSFYWILQSINQSVKRFLGGSSVTTASYRSTGDSQLMSSKYSQEKTS